MIHAAIRQPVNGLLLNRPLAFLPNRCSGIIQMTSLYFDDSRAATPLKIKWHMMLMDAMQMLLETPRPSLCPLNGHNGSGWVKRTQGGGKTQKLLWIWACGKDSSRTPRALISLLNYAAEMKRLFIQGLGGGGEEEEPVKLRRTTPSQLHVCARLFQNSEQVFHWWNSWWSALGVSVCWVLMWRTETSSSRASRASWAAAEDAG